MLRIIIISVALFFLWRLVKGQLLGPATRRQDLPGSSGGSARAPYEVLGVAPTATPEEIRAAYQALVRQYHPDKVDNMAPELRELAEQRTKEINAAYNQLRKKGAAS